MSFPIDAVVTWVDGSDPAHAAKMHKYGNDTNFVDKDVAGATRYANDGEIFRCVASIRKFAPFVRTIYIVTDNQDPHIPDGTIPVRIVDHTEIFRGYEKYLPVFNSIAIETMTWRIPGLAEHYIKFNDDLMLCAPVAPSDFFNSDGSPVAYTKPYSIPWVEFCQALRPRKYGHKRIKFIWTLKNGARLAGATMRMVKIYHTPQALNRRFFEDWFAAHPEQMEKNIAYRFRNADQFNSEELYYYTMWKSKKMQMRKAHDYMFYLQPKLRKRYVERKLEKLKAGDWKFCCFNSLDTATDSERRTIFNWMDCRLDWHVPETDVQSPTL